MRRLIPFILLSLLAATAAGAARPARGPLHPKSAAGLMPPAYLASPADIAALQRRRGGDILQPYGALPLGTPASAAAGVAPGAVVGAGDNLLRLNWDTQLTVAQTVTGQAAPSAAAAGDLDGDGRPDIAAIQRPANRLAIARGSASGALAAPSQWPLAAEAEALLADDLNADCRTDLAYSTPSIVRSLLQTSGGALTAGLTLPFSNSSMADLASGDFNGDGQPDIAALRGTGGVTQHLALFAMRKGALASQGWRGVDDGGFAAHAVAVGDVTNDGRADLVVGAGGNVPGALINIFVQDQHGILATTPITREAWHIPEAIAIADLNHDGFNDIVALHSGWLTLTVYPGQASGPPAAHESYPLPYSTAYRPETLAVTDLNRDGGLDVLIADGNRGATYLLNRGGAPTAAIVGGPAACAVVKSAAFTLTGVLTDATALEVSLDGGATWAAAAVQGTTWNYSTTLPEGWVYPIAMVRARNGNRVQAPPATRRLVFQHLHALMPLLAKQ